MWNYTNTIVLNSLVDEESGLAKIVDIDSGIEVRRVNPFKKANVCALYKRKAEDAVAGSVEISVPNGNASDLYRYNLYVRLSGSQNSYYSNDLVFKGKPFVFEFAGDKNADAIVKLINKIKSLYDDKFLKVEKGANGVKFIGNNYTLFTVAKLEKFTPEDTNINGGEWVEVSATINNVPCNNGFGTYEQLLKDLRLPTMEARRWEAVNKEELPIPGAKYDQYTIEYAVERGVMGTDAVGQLVKSKTTHVFFVKSDLSADFETFIKKLEHDSVSLQTIASPLAITAAGADGSIEKAADSTEVITVTTDSTLKAISAESDQDWLSQSASNASAKTVTVKATENTTGATRKAKVKVVATDTKGSVASATVDLEQAGE